jgi:hypothetical protein
MRNWLSELRKWVSAVIKTLALITEAAVALVALGIAVIGIGLAISFKFPFDPMVCVIWLLGIGGVFLIIEFFVRVIIEKGKLDQEEKRRNAITSIALLIQQGNDVRNELDYNDPNSATGLAAQPGIYKRIDEWGRRSKKVVSDYRPDLASLLYSTETENTLSWIDERNARLKDLIALL